MRIAAPETEKATVEITEADRKLYFRNREFDEEAWEHVKEINKY